MENKIEQERKASRKYDLKRIKLKDGKYLVKLTHDNVARVEAMIRHNSDYSNSSKAENETSSAYWLSKLKDILINNNTNEDYKTVIEHCVEKIDIENSTHLNADGVGRIEMAERLYKLDSKMLLKYLKEPKQDNYELIRILSEPTHPIDSHKHARRNKSFASKFCHYACMSFFTGNEQDNFSIFDSILCDAIPLYADYYNIEISKKFPTSYSEYISVIDQIIQKSGDEISRNGFDHLVWYFHKAK